MRVRSLGLRQRWRSGDEPRETIFAVERPSYFTRALGTHRLAAIAAKSGGIHVSVNGAFHRELQVARTDPVPGEVRSSRDASKFRGRESPTGRGFLDSCSGSGEGGSNFSSGGGSGRGDGSDGRSGCGWRRDSIS